MIRNALECAEDFQSYSLVRVSARNYLMRNTRFTTAPCAGVCWNAPECARVGHSLGTNRSGAYWMTSSALSRRDCWIGRSSALAVLSRIEDWHKTP